jgi:hypothetical protein
MAVVVALRCGSGPAEWMADPRALVTAVELLVEADRKAKR